ncbi:hypothetical protein PT110_09185 [Erysipelothrix rhusiopathiae]|nr:hypothetical protein [Erysipelothrix rhusiopathiae]
MPQVNNEIVRIFMNKGWDYESNARFQIPFKRAYNQYRILKKSKKKINLDLYLELLELFTVYDEIKYNELIQKSVEKISDHIKKFEVKKVFFIPLISPNIIQENKIQYYSELNSSTFLLYQHKSSKFQSILREYIDEDITVEFLKNINMIRNDKYLVQRLKKINNDSRGEIIILLDDFSGSGNSVINTLDILDSVSTSLLDKTMVSLLFVTDDAMKKIEEKYVNCKISYEIRVDKLCYLYDEAEYEIVKSEIEKISEELDITENRLGYNNDGCLVSLMRTPNNTIGIFSDTEKGIFPRDK